MNQFINLPDIILMPRNNYRYAKGVVLSTEVLTSLKEFGQRIISEGQQTAIRVADITGTGDKKLLAIAGKGTRILIDGERRIRGLELAAPKAFKVAIKIIPIKDYLTFKHQQIMFNVDRVNTTFTQDGRGFIEFTEAGGTIAQLVKMHAFPPTVLTKKARTAYIKNRLELTKGLDPALYPALDKGLLQAFKSKKHQGYILLNYPKEFHVAVAKRYEEAPNYYSNDRIIGYLDGHRKKVDLDKVPFDPKDASLGIEKFGTTTCVGCRFLKNCEIENPLYNSWQKGLAEEKGETYPHKEIIQQDFCYETNCLEEKMAAGTVAKIEELKKEYPHFVWAGAQSKSYGEERPAKEEIKGRLLYRFYDIVERGTCASSLAALVYEGEGNSNYKGQLLHICPASSGCTIHHAKNFTQKAEVRTERLNSEKVKVSTNTVYTTGYEWVQKVSTLETHFTPVMEEIKGYLIKNHIEELWRRLDKKGREFVRTLLDKDFLTKENHTVRYAKQFDMAYKKHGFEKVIGVVSTAFMVWHNSTGARDLIPLLGKKVGVDYKKLLKQNSNVALNELSKKHEKRQGSWAQEKAKLLKQRAAFAFDIPILLGMAFNKDKRIDYTALSDKKVGAKVCRMTGVSMPKGVDYVHAEIVVKLEARQQELEKMFPDFQLTDEQNKFMGAMNAAKTGKYKMLNHKWDDDSIAATFLNKCLTKAGNLKDMQSIAEIITARVDYENIYFQFNTKELVKICQTVIKEEEWKSIVTFDKENKCWVAIDEADGRAIETTIKEVKKRKPKPKSVKITTSASGGTGPVILNPASIEVETLLEECEFINQFINAPIGLADDRESDWKLLNNYLSDKGGRWKGTALNYWEFPKPVLLKLNGAAVAATI